MAAVPMDNLFKLDLTHDKKLKIQQLIKDRIPTGNKFNSEPLLRADVTLDGFAAGVHPTRKYMKELLDNKRFLCQIVSLGGVNHFLEVVYEEDLEQVWLMLHLGSRGLDHTVATFTIS